MTRGQIAVITENGILTSAEFNGNMYPREDGYGLEIFRGLNEIHSEEEYRAFVKDFDRKHFGYDEDLFYDCGDNCFNMSGNYYNNWGSDFLYIKNLTDYTKVFTDAADRQIRLEPNEKVIFNYGAFYLKDERDLDKRLVFDKLLEIKDNLDFFNRGCHYNKIYNACRDYDDKHDDLNLIDRIDEENFYDDEAVSDMIKGMSTDINKLRYFLSNAYDDDLYHLTGYENLENVVKEDFETLIDTLTEIIEKSILPDLT